MGNYQCGFDEVQTEVNIGLVGYGRMGRAIESLAKSMQCEVTSIIDPNSSFQSICEASTQNIDVLIDFSTPNAAVENIKKAAHLQKNIVVGTTGWYDQIEEVRKLAASAGVGVLYSPNFSIGIQLFMNMVEQAAQLIDSFDEYDIAGVESHHNKKIDVPSGTARALGNILLKNISRKHSITYGNEVYNNASNTIHFPSVRCGDIAGTHSVAFDSPVDTITLTHQARSRDGFARGALQAAKWLNGKSGFFTLNDMLIQGK